MCDGEYPAVIDKARKKARRDYVCSECWHAIHKGDTYEHVRGLWDGTWSTCITCAFCADLRAYLYPSGNIDFGSLADAVWGDTIYSLEQLHTMSRDGMTVTLAPSGIEAVW